MESLEGVSRPEGTCVFVAPFGPGVYELRNSQTRELVLFGSVKNLAYRMACLLPKPYGAGHRSTHAPADGILH